MAIYEYDGSNHQIGELYEWNGSSNSQIGKLYEYDGTKSYLIYTSWNGELLDGADKFTDITGGYDGNNYTGSTWMVNASNNNNGILIYSGSGTWHKSGTVYWIDVSAYSRIVFDISAPNGLYTTTTVFGLYSAQNAVYTNAVKSVGDNNYTNLYVKSKSYTLDISGISGTYFIGLFCYSGANYPITITKITMY